MTIIAPSPEGVPGAVLDPAAIAAEDLTYPGAEGTLVKLLSRSPRRAAVGAPGPVLVAGEDSSGVADVA